MTPLKLKYETFAHNSKMYVFTTVWITIGMVILLSVNQLMSYYNISINQVLAAIISIAIIITMIAGGRR